MSRPAPDGDAPDGDPPGEDGPVGHAPGGQAQEGRSDPTVREALGGLAQNTGVARVRPGEIPTVASLLAAIGGVRGLVESILPSLGFLVLFTTTGDLAVSVLVPVGIAVAFVIARAVSRTPVLQAVIGLIGVGVAAALALWTGRPEDNFLPGLIINAVYFTVFAASVIVRYPLIGLVVGAIANEGLAWRRDRAKLRVLTVATVLWMGLFGLRLAVQVPLYLAGEAELLAGARLALGVPVYAAVLWVTWLLVRTVYSKPGTPVVDET